ncbi:universal stress protein, partial [Mycobacterium intracellulare]|uniref:universal stress protein n=1 Tax=Mycobacterium intracellulare TaxID=1767 RepID=UPI000B170A86
GTSHRMLLHHFGSREGMLVAIVEEVRADLMVVGNVGLNSVAGRLLGSVPSEVSRRVKTDVLIVHTAN